MNDLRFYLTITLLTGFYFLFWQFIVWEQLVNSGVYLVGNPTGSFLYLFSGLHGVYFLIGMIIVTKLLIHAFQNKVNTNNLLDLECYVTYWHFMSGVWAALFVFIEVF